MPRPQSHRAVGFRPLLSDQSGSILVLAAASMAMLVAIGAFSFSISSAYDRRNQLHAAADAAAKSGAISIHQLGDALDATELTRFGAKAVADTGITGATLDIHRCDVLGATCTAPYNTHTFVEAFVSQDVNTFFSRLLPSGTLRPGGRAVAGYAASRACFVVIHDLGLGNNNQVHADTCSIEVGNNSGLGNGTDLYSGNIIGVGGSYGDAGDYHPGVQDLPMFSDPLATTPEPAMPSGPCIATPQWRDETVNITAGKYCGWTFRGDVTLNLGGGTYYMDGLTDDFNGGTNVYIRGTGVLIYLGPSAEWRLDDSNFVDINLTAMTTGPQAGLVFFQSRSNTRTATFGKNNGATQIDGGMYFPNNTLVFGKNNGVTSAAHCAVIVARDVSADNNWVPTFENTCGSFGGSPIRTIAMAE